MSKYLVLTTLLSALYWQSVNAQINFVEHIIGTQADGPHFVAIADIDGDSDMDLVSSSEFDSDLRVYYNNGNQVFTDQILTWVTASNLIVTDFDEDNDLDIFTTCGADGTISWFRNLGGGNFNTAATYNEGSPRAAYLILADTDQDGDLDIVTSRNADTPSSTLSSLENDGFNQFSTQQAIATAAPAEKVAAADLNNDGFPEIITVTDGAVRWYANNAGNIATTGTLIDNTVSARAIDVADFNADGFLDIAVGSLDYNKPLAWYPNNGGTAFGTFRLISNLFDYIHDVKAADFDGDGDMDVVGSDSEMGHKIVWFANNGTGTFGVLRTVNNDIASPHGLAVGDIDGDGDIDIAATSSWDDQVIWYENQITGSAVQSADNSNNTLQATRTNSNAIQLTLDAAEPDRHALLHIYDVCGKVVAQQTWQIEAGPNQLSIPMQGLPAGMYIARLYAQGQSMGVKWIY